MKKKSKKLPFHHRIRHHLRKHIHNHVHKIFHIHHHLHHHLLHVGELIAIVLFTLISGTWMFANLTGYSEELYRNNSAEVAQALVEAMQNPGKSLKQGNIISIWTMDMNVENTFAKGYCTYGAARISPEFFPYIDSQTQQRTRGGNAVDRCKNAAETGYKIGMTPAQGALIVYDAGGRFGVYGHVGKVMHYDSSLKKIIVRDMAWVAKGTMSDRREDLTTAQVKCYIYNSKTTSPNISTPQVDQTNTGNVPTTVTGVITPPPPSTPTIPTPPATPTSPTTSRPPVPPIVPIIPNIQPTTPTTTGIQQDITKKLSLIFDNLSDIAEHFLTQNDITITLTTKSPLTYDEYATLAFEITNKNGNPFKGLLPFAFTVLSTNDSLKPGLSNIKIINNGKVHIPILAQKAGKATIVINMDGTKIGDVALEVK